MERREHILEAAVRRFAHFGVQKTTMTEIADDLGMSKQALFYYFTDKHSLTTAVEDQIIEEFFGLIEAACTNVVGVEQTLVGIVEVKKSFLEKYAMLMQAVGSEAHSNNRVEVSKKKVRERLVLLMSHVLEQGITNGELKKINTAEVGALIYDTLHAFEQCAIGRQTVPDPKALAQLYDQQKSIIRLLVNGIKKDTWKN